MDISIIKGIVKEFLLEEDAIGVVEIILILVILIGLVIIFKDEMNSLIQKIFSSITRDTGKVLD